MVRQRDARELIPMHSAVVGRRLMAQPGELPRDGDISSIYLMGRFDLEKVARAGLEAIKGRGLDDGIPTAFYRAAPGDLPSPDAALEAMIDAILKKQP
jgi:hypothetical protein